MSASVNENRLQKQGLAAVLLDVDGNPDLTTTVTPTITLASPAGCFDVVQKDSRHWDVVGQAVGSGAIRFDGAGKQDNVGVTITQSPDMSSLVVSLDGVPVPK